MNNQSYLAFQWVSSHTSRIIINFFLKWRQNPVLLGESKGRAVVSPTLLNCLQAHSKRDPLAVPSRERASELQQNLGKLPTHDDGPWPVTSSIASQIQFRDSSGCASPGGFVSAALQWWLFVRIYKLLIPWGLRAHLPFICFSCSSWGGLGDMGNSGPTFSSVAQSCPTLCIRISQAMRAWRNDWSRHMHCCCAGCPNLRVGKEKASKTMQLAKRGSLLLTRARALCRIQCSGAGQRALSISCYTNL